MAEKLARDSARWGCLAFLIAFAITSEGHAQWESPVCVTDLDDAEVRERLEFLEDAIERAEPRGKAWWYSWLAINANAIALQSVRAARADNRDDRGAALVYATGPALSIVALALRPLETGLMRRRLGRADLGNERERLEYAERLLFAAADREDADRSWVRHLLLIGYSGITAMIVGLVFDQPRSALRIGLANFVGGEVQVLSIPRAAQRAVRDYRSRFGPSVCAYDPHPEMPWREFTRRNPAELGLSPFGASLTIAF